MIILIPAYEPDDRLVALARSIRIADPQAHVVIVDDGSGASFSPVFDAARALGCDVIGYPANHGKGYALKSGFRHAARSHPGESIVCADCDGQHSIVDILRVAERVRTSPAAMVLGARQFTGAVPARSRFGNAVTRVLLRLATRLPIHDTQTGLRGYPASMLGWLQTIAGDRFEYELNLLLHAAEAGYRVEELEIATIYLEGNASSHFRPIADSARIYAPLVKFGLSSVAAFALDTIAVLALYGMTGALLPSVIGARMLSSTVNFLTNRGLVFAHGTDRTVGRAAARYWTLAAVLLAANYGMLSALTSIGIDLLPAKVLTEASLWAASYHAQRRLVFSSSGAPEPQMIPTEPSQANLSVLQTTRRSANSRGLQNGTEFAERRHPVSGGR